MEALIGALTGLGTSLVSIAVAWGKFSTRIEVLERRMDETISKQEESTKAMFALTIEITKLTGEIKELRNIYGKL